MSEYTTQKRLVPAPQNGAPLDTLGQLRKTDPEPSKSLRKRARSKFATKAIVTALTEHAKTIVLPPWGAEMDMAKYFRGAIYCSDTITQEDGRLKTHYCDHRACFVCNRIRTAKNVIGYGEPLGKLSDPKFVTLTRKTMPADELYHAAREGRDIIQRSSDAMRKAKRPLIGVRKIEVTERPGGLYHPHFHLIVDGQDAAEELVERSMKAHNRNQPGRCDPSAQDIRDLDERGMIELFKYFTKLTTKVGNTRQISSIKSIVIMMAALRGMRTYQPMGIRKAKELIAIEEGPVDTDLRGTPEFKRFGERVLWEWDQQVADWLDHLTGECLSGSDPSDRFRAFVNTAK